MRNRSAVLQKVIRCAIYTRKSTDEGLEQEFNSLDAQREACTAYITSQRHEGWTMLPDFYDDGGYSGGSMERPALKALLAEVAAGHIDVIVVYKVDRLTRSLADFAKIVEILDERDASFVSVTQSFNTTTSMGRLTLNVLLSFAQFEREVTGERIRDKIAASKAKGMWMGGVVPLGYKIEDRRLHVEPAEADLIRHIFTRYLELGSGIVLMEELEHNGIRSRACVNKQGRRYGGHVLSRGALYAILQNRIYVGEVRHKDQHYPGQHEAIISSDLFEQVQQRLAGARVERKTRMRAKEASLLAGLLVDGHGRRMSPSHANKAGRRYRYYRSQMESKLTDDCCWRISAPDIEALAQTMLRRAVQEAVTERIGQGDLPGSTIKQLNLKLAEVDKALSTQGTAARALFLSIVPAITINEGSIIMDLDVAGLDTVWEGASRRQISAPVNFVRSGDQVKLVIPASTSEQSPNAHLLKLVAQAFAARQEIESGMSLKDVAQRQAYSIQYAADLIRISYLSPTLIQAILEGRQAPSLTRRDLIRAPRVPLCWRKQEQLFAA